MALVGFVAAVWHRVGYVQLGLAALTVALAGIGALVTFLVQHYDSEPRTLRGFLRFCLPMRLLLAQQTWLDLGYALLKKVTRFLWGWGFVGDLTFAYLFYRALGHLGRVAAIGARPAALHPPGLFGQTVFLAVGLVIVDFTTFYAHYLEHKIALLWQFHKVHHSALTLVPATNRRFHPVQEVWDALWNAAAAGLWIAVYARVTAAPLADVTILGINVYLLANSFCFHLLRHSHIYMRYPRWLEGVLLSPAQHQIHHSREERHLDRNFGLFLACWDRLFGTIVYSEPVPVTNLGLVSDQERYLTLWSLFFMPFVELAQKCPAWLGRTPLNKPSP